MFAVASLEPGEHVFSFKCTPDKYAELVERPGIVPAPYLARASGWRSSATMRSPGPRRKSLLRVSYDLVFMKLPRKIRAGLG